MWWSAVTQTPSCTLVSKKGNDTEIWKDMMNWLVLMKKYLRACMVILYIPKYSKFKTAELARKNVDGRQCIQSQFPDSKSSSPTID